MLKYKIPQIVTLILVQKKEKGVELIVLTPCISVSYIKFLNISSLVPPDAYSNRAELHPELRMQR